MASERLVDGVTYYIITLIPEADNRALEVYGGGELGNVGKNTQLRIAVVDPKNDATARWKAEDLGDGYLFSNVKEANMALDVQYAATADGTPVILYERHGNANQRWRISRVAGV
ncbi:ricin B lectin domain-containing protein [Aspergillus multicolor]|uniref:ricin B lectin domain-containing protein n=1 Tax=Aspergillus multicolor TaxID=41759 RepID=UPI003CCD7EF9